MTQIPEQQLKNLSNEKPYSVRRKKIHKGKVAPINTVYLTVSFKRFFGGNTTKYESTQHIRGGLSSEQEAMIGEMMYNSLLTKYKLSR